MTSPTSSIPPALRVLALSFARGICYAPTLERKASLCRHVRMFEPRVRNFISLHVFAIASAQAFAASARN